VRRRYNYRCRAPPSCRDIKTHPFPPEASLPSLPPITLSLLAHRSLSLSLSLSPLYLFPRVFLSFFLPALAGSRVEFRDRRERSNAIRYQAFSPRHVRDRVCDELSSTSGRPLDRSRSTIGSACDRSKHSLLHEIYAPKNGVVIARGWQRAAFPSRDEISGPGCPLRRPRPSTSPRSAPHRFSTCCPAISGRRSRISVMTSRVKRAKYKAARGPYAATASRQVYSPGGGGEGGGGGFRRSMVMYSYRAPRESTYNIVKQFPRALLSHGPRGAKERKYLPARTARLTVTP